jgi:GntR family transcriptional regulator/MocR family aminotransferase
MGLVEISNVEAGLQTIGWLREGVSAEHVAAAAAKKNVEVIPLQRYAFGRVPGNGIVLGFAAVEPRELRRGVEELVSVLRR